MAGLYLSLTGVFATTGAGTNAFIFNYDTFSYLGSGVSLDVWVDSKVSNPVSGDDLIITLKFYETATGDIIYQLSGTLNADDEVTGSIAAVAYAMGVFSSLDIIVDQLAIVDAVLDSDAYNAYNAIGTEKVTFSLPDEQPPAFDADQVHAVLTASTLKPSYLTLPRTDDLAVFNCVMRAAQKLNIQLDAEIDPAMTVDEACLLADDLSVDDDRLHTIWSPNECRPRDAVSRRGRMMPARAIGQYLGYKLLRNSKTTADGIPLIAEPVTGEKYPFKLPKLKTRDGILYTPENLQKLATSKINVVRPISFEDGIKFILSDGLTHYRAKPNSALKLVNSAEILCFTFNKCLEILRKHMLRSMSSYLSDASKEIDGFLAKCSSPTAGLLKPATDLGGRPYRFSLFPDQDYPFERVRFRLERRPEGLVRSVITEDIAVK